MGSLLIHGLAAISFLLVASGCSLFFGDDTDPIEHLRAEVRASVPDEERAAAMLKSVDEIDRILTESATVLTEAATQEATLFVNYDSRPEQFEALFERTYIRRRALQEKLLSAHLEFKASATPAEWPRLSAAQSQAVKAKTDRLLREAIRGSNER